MRDPYEVLGISHGASKEDIKRAYRQKAKECHPDLHPNDPHAQEKMNEINTAYDMLSNPEKYNNQQQAQQNYNNQQQGYYNNGYNQQGYNQQGYNQGGYYGNFGGFGFGNFGDFFGQSRSIEIERPRVMPGDSQEIAQAIDLMNSDNWAWADRTLNQIISAERNARWYYLSAICNLGLSNTVEALQRIERAVQIEPQNQTYQKIYQAIQMSGARYSEQGHGYNMAARTAPVIMACCAAELMCLFCRGPICFI